MSVHLSPIGNAFQFFNANGRPLSLGSLYTYAAGTSTPQTTYSDSAGSVPNANPIVLDASGRVPSEVWLTDGQAYKFVLKDSVGSIIGTYDNLTTLADISAFAASTGASLVGWQGTGAPTLRTVQTKLQDFVSVKDFGAVGDGVTNDAVAIAAAISATSNGTVFFPPGVYCVGSAGILVSGKTDLRIQGFNAVIKLTAVSGLTNMTGSSASIKLLNCTRVAISDLEVNGNSIASDAITLQTSTDCSVERCVVYSCGASGLVTSFGGVRTRIVGNTLSTAVGAARGLWCGNYLAGELETNLEIIGNVVHDNPASGIIAASVGARVAYNHAKTNGGSGIVVGGANGFSSARVSIVGNVCESNSFHGIQSDVTFTSSADIPADIVVSSNICYNNTHTGIYALYSLRWTITGNDCRDNPDAGIYCARFEKINVSGNTCCDGGVGAGRKQTIGIALIAEAGNNLIDANVSGNTCNNNLNDGIRCQNTTTETMTGFAFAGNSCSGNGSRGLAISDAVGTLTSFTSFAVTGNVCAGNTTTDLRVDPLETSIDGNLFLTQISVSAWVFTDGATTPSIKGARRVFKAANTGATVITNFTNPAVGQSIEVWFTTANTTINNGGNFALKGGVNVTPVSNSFMSFYWQGSLWVEKWRNF